MQASHPPCLRHESRMITKVLRRLLVLALTIFFAGAVSPVFARHPSDSQGEFPTPGQYAAMLGKGLDVDWSKTRKGMQTFSERAVKDFKAAGFSHVRIRVKDPLSKKLLSQLDEQVRLCEQHSLIPVLAYQAGDFKKDPTRQNMNDVVRWWKIVAEYFKDATPMLSFDLLIEATEAVNKEPQKLNLLYEESVAAIRETNPQRIIFISPRMRSDPAYLHELKIPSRHNNRLMAEWHFYASGPSKVNESKMWTTGTPEEKRIILDKIRTAKEWEKQTGIPTWIGAWMPGSYNDGNDYPINEQVAFARFVASELDKAKIPFAVNSDSKFYDRARQSWIPSMRPVLAAILSPEGKR